MHIDLPNMWIGPNQSAIISLGAMFTPCMRHDNQLLVKKAKYANIKSNNLGCCEVTGFGAGTTTENDCDEIVKLYKLPNYLWRNGSTCAFRDSASIIGGFEIHKFKPCCFGYKGECMLVSRNHCDFLHGHWYSSGSEHCSQTHCDAVTCHTQLSDALAGRQVNIDIVSQMERSNKESTLPKPTGESKSRVLESGMSEDHSLEKHNQLWRLPLSLLYHRGILHLLLVVVTQLALGVPAERLAGWLRIGTIYMVCWLEGLMAGSSMRPLEATVGGGGTVAGLIGVHLVELVQSWKLVHRPCLALLKLLAALALFIGAGFLPQVNQFVQLAGSVFGMLTAIICLPYITFNRWHSKARVIIICVSLFILTGLIFTCFILFYKVQLFDIGILKYLNCTPLIKYSCNDN